MSAIEAFAKPKIVWPELPIELWVRILRCATSLPDDFDLELVRGEFQLHYSAKLYREVLVTARKIVRVSKLWNDLATPFLYETIFIAKSRHLVKLRASLRKSLGDCMSVDSSHPVGSQGSATGATPTRRQPLGFWIRRLVITLQPPYTPEIDVTSEILDLITWLSGGLAALHLLVPLPNYPSRFVSPAFLRVLNTHHRKTLRCLNLTTNEPDREVSLETWYGFLEEMKSLSAFRCDVRCNHTRPDIFYKPHGLSIIAIPMAEFLDPEYPTSSVVDGLHELITSPHVRIAPPGPCRLNLSVPHFGNNLTTLTLDMHRIDPAFSFSLCLPPFFPNLVYLRLSCRSWDALLISGENLLIPPSVVHLRLSSLHHTSTNQIQYTYLDSILEYLEGSSLKVIQLGGRPLYRDLAQRHSSLLYHMAEKVRTRGMELHDPDDNAVV
ncbi:F-box domain-containing protein [Pleurotus pulmonarius]